MLPATEEGPPCSKRSPSWRLARKALRHRRLTVIYDFLPPSTKLKRKTSEARREAPSAGAAEVRPPGPPPSCLPDSLQPSLVLRCPPGAAGPLLPARPAARPLPICRGEQRESAGERGARPPPAQPWRGQFPFCALRGATFGPRSRFRDAALNDSMAV